MTTETNKEIIAKARRDSEPFPRKIRCAICGIMVLPERLVRQWDGKVVCKSCKDKKPERYDRDSYKRTRLIVRLPFMKRGDSE